MDASKFINDIKGLPEDVVAIATVEGIVEWNIENLIQQPLEGLLYDLNRDMATNYTRLAEGDIRAVNDIATAKIIGFLLKNCSLLQK